MAVSCSDDDDGDDASSKGGSSGSSGQGGSSGSATGGGSGRGGSNTGGSNTGGSNTGGRAGSAGSTPTGGTSGSGGTGTSGDGGVGGDPTDGGMGGVDGTDGGMGGEGGEMTVADVLDNPGFEMGFVGTLLEIPGWQESGDLDASYVEWTGGRNGTHKLGHWRAWSTAQPEFDANTFQTVGPIPNGTYTFSMWVNRKLVLTSQYLFARGHNLANPTEEMTQDTAHANSEAGYTQITLSGIQVTSGQVTVGIHTHSWGDNWANIDDATLTKDP